MKKLKMLLGLLLGTMILTSCSSDLLNTNVDGPMTRSILSTDDFGQTMILGAQKLGLLKFPIHAQSSKQEYHSLWKHEYPLQNCLFHNQQHPVV